MSISGKAYTILVICSDGHEYRLRNIKSWFIDDKGNLTITMRSSQRLFVHGYWLTLAIEEV